MLVSLVYHIKNSLKSKRGEVYLCLLKDRIMDHTTNGTKSDWMICVVSTLLTLIMLKFAPGWFWVPMPFALTYFVKAMRWI